MLRGEELRKVYTSGIISVTKKTAVDRVSISIGKGETIAIVGESGCRKSTLVKMLTMQLPATEGEVYFSGEKLTSIKWKELRQHIVKFQMIPQNPDDAVDPRWELGRSVAEQLVLSGTYSREEIAKIVPELLAEVGLGPEFMSRFPHQVSGGELQRIVIARALALKPDLLICDEATSMLDVSVQSYIMSLLKDIQKKRNIALIIITHDLVFANAVANLTYVMFGGNSLRQGRMCSRIRFILIPRLYGMRPITGKWRYFPAKSLRSRKRAADITTAALSAMICVRKCQSYETSTDERFAVFIRSGIRDRTQALRQD